MDKINAKGLLLRIFIPAAIFSMVYFVLGYICRIPLILLFCFLGTVILLPIELGMILRASKKEYGTYSLRSAFVGQERIAVWKAAVMAFALFGITGLVSVSVAPVENQLFAQLRRSVLQRLPAAFDWTDYEYLKAFSRPMLVFTCVYYSIFNVLVGPVVEELFFRGYLTSHYEKQGWFTPILVAVLFSLYHFWLPFNNVFRILAIAPAAYLAYREKNLWISVGHHCLCNLFSTVGFVLAVLE